MSNINTINSLLDRLDRELSKLESRWVEKKRPNLHPLYSQKFRTDVKKMKETVNRFHSLISHFKYRINEDNKNVKGSN